jgi:hypothetical protein
MPVSQSKDPERRIKDISRDLRGFFWVQWLRKVGDRESVPRGLLKEVSAHRGSSYEDEWPLRILALAEYLVIDYNQVVTVYVSRAHG